MKIAFPPSSFVLVYKLKDEEQIHIDVFPEKEEHIASRAEDAAIELFHNRLQYSYVNDCKTHYIFNTETEEWAHE